MHLYGHPVELDPVLSLAAQYGLVVVEDACQAHGARYEGRTVGTIASLGALSFYPTKNLGAFGDGGAVLAADADDAARLRQLRNGGQNDRYSHDLSGINSRLDEMQAAILRAKLGHLDAWNERRRQLAALYNEELRGASVVLQHEQPYARAVNHLYVIRHKRRDALVAALAAEGIQALIHYPVPLHLQGAFRHLGGKPGDSPVAEQACGELLSLPLYPELGDDAGAPGRGRGPAPGRTGVNLVDPAAAILAALVLFLAPGILFLAWLEPADKADMEPCERLFLAAAAGACAAAWSALLFAELGIFSLPRCAAAVGAACLAGALLARRLLSSPWRGARASRVSALAIALLALAFGLQARPSEYLFGGRDPGTYIAAMGQIARTGAIAYVDPVVLAIPAQDRSLFFRGPGSGEFSSARFMGFPHAEPGDGAGRSGVLPPVSCVRRLSLPGDGRARRARDPGGLRHPRHARVLLRAAAHLRRRGGGARHRAARSLRHRGVVRALPGVGNALAVPDLPRPSCAWRAGKSGARRRSASSRVPRSACRCWCASTAS